MSHTYEFISVQLPTAVMKCSFCLLSLQTSDVGEAFRPVVSPHIVTAAYGISWLYLAGSVHPSSKLII